MIHHLQHIADLVEICRLKEIREVVVSPGSRNAPLIQLFASEKSFRLHSIVDERSAGFFGLGISLATQKPVLLICTSGTAVLNFAPALSEAYYQHIPLIAITADRPEELIDQQDNQTIRQVNVFQNFVKGSINLSSPVKSIDELELQHLSVNNLINSSVDGIKGPVHINVPLSEPLYVEIPKPSEINIASEIKKTGLPLSDEILTAWKSAKKRMVLCGLNSMDEKLKILLNRLADQHQTVVLAEPVSNIKGKNILSEIDRVMIPVESDNSLDFQPDLLISMGGPVVSKRLKLWLQKQTALKHFRISEADDHIDTYHNLTRSIIRKPVDVFSELVDIKVSSEEHFVHLWEKSSLSSFQKHREFLSATPFSDLKAFDIIMNNLPAGCVLHLGNSSPVRYGQLFDSSVCSGVYSNRGVSGIDGCLSTAAGFASQSDQINVLILGDLSFLYDSNGLWNRNLSSNLRIVVINNQGGGIFRLISGPSEKDYFEEFMEAHHPVEIEKLVSAYNVKYYSCDNQEELKNTFNRFIQSNSGPDLLEIKTPGLENARVYAEYFRKLKNE
jgi:2-succinyl-5-enolpyruvyl-6-hydroxy-3-cyclohexene-1-carboxylate synthase